MRFIGNKENIIDKIYSIMQENDINGNHFCDFFSGTTNVARFFKRLGYQISCCDLLYLSYCLQKAYIENNEEPLFSNILPKIAATHSKLFETTALEQIVDYLNNIEPIKGFIYQNYTPEGTKELEQPRMYFSPENGMKIDAIRTQIEIWFQNKEINETEYYILIACLIETVPFYANIAGVYAAFHKKWDPRAIKPLVLRPIRIVKGNKCNTVANCDSITLCKNIETDILYIDPPYNQRQYAPNYHLLETIAKYDNPQIYGVTGMRDYSNQKSSFCSTNTALKDLSYIASTAKYKYLILSYNSEGIMPQEKIINTLSRFGEVKLEQFEYTRYKSNSNGLSNKIRTVYEQLYILKHNG